MVNPPIVHKRLRLRLIAPIVIPVADGRRQAGRHMNENVPCIVGSASLQYEDPLVGSGTEAIRQTATCRAAADDDKVVLVRSGVHLDLELARPNGVAIPRKV